MFILILQQLLIMLFIMVLGFICYKLRLVTQEGNKMCSNLLLLVITPTIVLLVSQADYNPVFARNLVIAFAAAVGSHIIAIVAARIVIPKKNNPEYAVESFCCVYSNSAFMGIPLIYSVLGNEGVFYLSAYIVTFNLLAWTHGVGLMKGSFSLKYLKEGILSPVILSVIVTIPMYFMQIKIPPLLLDAMELVSNLMTPLAMLVAGFSLAQVDLKTVLKKRELYRTNLVKLIIMPVLTLLVLARLPIDRHVIYAILIASACPAAVSAALMPMRFGKNYKLGTEIFVFSTVLSLLTLPIMVLLAGYLIG